MKILVVKLADLGDLLLSEPALRSLRRAYPDARIDVLTTPHAAELLPHFKLQLNGIAFEKSIWDAPGVAALAAMPQAGRLANRLRSAHYDGVVILHHLTTAWGAAKFRALAACSGAPTVVGLDNGRGSFLTAAAVDRGFGFKHEAQYMRDVAVAAGGRHVPVEPRFYPTPDELPAALPQSFIAIAPTAGAFSSARIWPLERFVALSRELIAADHRIVVVGGDDAVAAGDQIVRCASHREALDLTGHTTPNQLALTLKQSTLLITNDSFPAHLGAAVGAPVLALFGPSNARSWRPIGDRSIALSADLPCSPCLYTGYRLGRRAGCPSRTCLARITPAMVFEQAMEMLGA